jgi:hypothetical protein
VVDNLRLGSVGSPVTVSATVLKRRANGGQFDGLWPDLTTRGFRASL